jgi:uncharacterized damage-inducible protein DinB
MSEAKNEPGTGPVLDAKNRSAPGPEPWLRGAHDDVPAVPRAVVHALELAREDIEKWCGGLSDEELNARPHGLAPVAFHLRHLARSIDRLLTYAEGRELDSTQVAALKSEMEAGATHAGVFDEVKQALESGCFRVRAIRAGGLEAFRGVGKKQLPTSVGGLLVHVADHTQRHVGQAVITAKVLISDQK